MKKVIAIIIALSVLSSVGYIIYHYIKKEKSTHYKLSGELEMKYIDLSFLVPGRIIKRNFDEGQTVKKGELVAELDPKEYKLQVDLSKANMSASEWQLNELVAGNTAQDILQARKQLDSAREEQQRIKKDFDRAKELYDAKVMSEADYDKQQTAYNVAKLKVAEISERVKQLEIGPRKEKIEQARAQYQASEVNKEIAEEKLSYTKLYSPVDGVIITEYKNVGEFINAGTPILSIGDRSKLWLRTYLPENLAHIIKIGDKVEVKVDSLPNETFEGIVSFISDKAEFTPKQIQTEIERVKLVYRVKIDIVDSRGVLKPGIPADALIKK